MLGFLGYPSWLWPLVAVAAATWLVVVVVGHAIRPKYRRLFGWRAPLKSLENALLPCIGAQLYYWLALIVLWTPVWWLARAASAATGAGTATAWFVTAVGLFYGGWLVRGFAGRSVDRSLAMPDGGDEGPPPSGRRRVAVIGAGMAGLVAAKELRDEGHEVVVYERTSGPGGVWAASKARGGVAWGSTMTSTGALNTVLSDSVRDLYHPANGRFPHHFDRAQFHDLLIDFEADHGVFADTLVCDTEVEAMTRIPGPGSGTGAGDDDRGGDRWRLRLRDTVDGTRFEETFDAVTICTGLNKEAFTPEIDGRDRFLGPQLHAEDYRPAEVERFAGRRVLVVGMGETASDVVKDLVDNGAEHVYVSQRGPTWVIPRDVGSLPPDHVETRLLHDGPMLHRWLVLATGVVPFGLLPLLRPTRVKVHNPLHVLRILVWNHPRKWQLWRLSALNWTKSDNLYFAMDTGRATVVRDVERLEEDAAVFADAGRRPVDAVIYCTGYRPGPSLLPPSAGAVDGTGGGPAVPRSARDLYKLTIPPDHPHVACIGFARGQIGAITLSSELQARWWALVVSGKRRLPPAPAMRRHVADLRHHGRRFHQPTRTTPTFASSVARQDIGCEPDLFRLFRTDRRLWFAVLMGPVCAAQFRLRGPQACVERARSQLLAPQAVQSDDYVDSVDLLTNTLPLAALVVPLMAAWSRILPGFNARHATRSYI